MDNKNDKTFTDIFSSSKTDLESTQTFSDILKNSVDDKMDDKSETLTFDNLFDKVFPESNSSESVALENDLSQKQDNEAELFEKINALTVELGKTNNQDNAKEENIFFTKTVSDNSEQTASEEQIKTPFANFPSIFDESDNTEGENPFFSDSTPDSNIEKKEKVENTATISSTNPLFGESNNEGNPFFVDLASNDNIEKAQEAIEMPPVQSTNPFFDEAPNKSEENSNLTSSNQNDKSLIKEKIEENTQVKTSSPFFEEPVKIEEENPFFQNKISLMENATPSNTNGNIDISNSKHYNVKIVKEKEPLIKLILGVLSYALFIWLLLIGVTLLVYVLDIKIRAAKGDYSSPTFNAYVVLTGSMLPEIQVYDVVVTKKVDAENLKEGDVITFASADTRFLGTIITHRIIKKNPPSGTEGFSFQTKGDNNNVADSALVPEDRIFGKVILKIPKLGYLQEFLAADGGWIIVILIPCLVVISYDIVKLIKGLKRKKYKNIKVQK